MILLRTFSAINNRTQMKILEILSDSSYIFWSFCEKYSIISQDVKAIWYLMYDSAEDVINWVLLGVTRARRFILRSINTFCNLVGNQIFGMNLLGSLRQRQDVLLQWEYLHAIVESDDPEVHIIHDKICVPIRMEACIHNST
jgi:hypothetical protein